jgi:transcriptional regulator with XRE-family HTH domain
MNTFIDRLDGILKAQGKNRNDLYDNLHIAKNMIGNWKQRGTIPSADIVCKIAKYLDTTAEYLVTGEDFGGYKARYESLLNDIQSAIDKSKQ